MIDAEILRSLGWSEELIKSVERVAFALHEEIDTTAATYIEVPNFHPAENDSSLYVDPVLDHDFTWPKF